MKYLRLFLVLFTGVLFGFFLPALVSMWLAHPFSDVPTCEADMRNEYSEAWRQLWIDALEEKINGLPE